MALLIGNADYSFAPLKNPLNDANDLGSRLASIGFETKVIANPGYKRFRSEIRSFYQEVSKDPETLSVFYYAAPTFALTLIADLNGAEVGFRRIPPA